MTAIHFTFTAHYDNFIKCSLNN